MKQSEFDCYCRACMVADVAALPVEHGTRWQAEVRVSNPLRLAPSCIELSRSRVHKSWATLDRLQSWLTRMGYAGTLRVKVPADPASTTQEREE